jgi:hypothetical protein
MTTTAHHTPNEASRAAPVRSTPSVARILADESYFGDGAPSWRRAPTSSEAKAVREKRIKRLIRFSERFPGAAELASIMTDSKHGDRCRSGACPECGRAFQRFLVLQFEKLANDADLTRISLAFPKHRTPYDHLLDLDTTSMRRSLSEAIKDIKAVHWIAGGIDLSLNDDEQKGQGLAWQPQFYGFAKVSEIAPMSKALRDSYRPTEVVPRPVHVKPWDGSEDAFSYSWKSEFYRRIAYQREVGPPGNRRICWHTRKISLRPPEHVQAMLWMHKIGLAGRLFLKGVRMTRSGQSVRLVQIKKRE